MVPIFEPRPFVIAAVNFRESVEATQALPKQMSIRIFAGQA